MNWGGEAASLVFLLIVTLILSDQDPTLINSFNFSYFLIESSPNRQTLEARVSLCEFWGHKHSAHNNSQKIKRGGLRSEELKPSVENYKITG